jgi:NADH-quinone oxidoreductase subunit G
VRIHPKEGSSRQLRDGQSVSLSANGTQIEALLKFDGCVAEETIVLPMGFAEIPVYDLSDTLLNGLQVDLRSK